ncbi:MAG TPA: glycosyltransferase [Gemmatimonadaceae bacterium]|nr:glycosyltransferase [Gemmatimonadaceae bacterium]
MICLLHGWLLEGSGSNLWTRSIITALCRSGETVHLVCQENHPERYEAIAEAYRHRLSGEVEQTLARESPYPGKCILHQPEIGATLPVFVWDHYEEYERVVPMIELSNEEIELYVERNVRVVQRIVESHPISAMHANHVVLMAVVAQRVSRASGVPYAVMPHGSGIEYAVKKDARFKRYASSALEDAERIFVIGREMRDRVTTVFDTVPELEKKFTELHLGVDTGQFEPVGREGRESNIRALGAALSQMPRGKTNQQTKLLRERASGEMSREALSALLDACGDYDGKKPDGDVEAKLASVDWINAPVLLFTGRIISMKGIQSVIAALPLILESVPDLRLIVVGHGPLREAMEALVWALYRGDRQLVGNIAAWGRFVERSPDADSSGGGLAEVQNFLGDLEGRESLESYFAAAERRLAADSVVFTGYLTHRELKFLFPCCDVGVFPSVVREAGPLVFLEALASGCFPLGTYFGGMAASIDAVAAEVPPHAASAMKLDLEHTVSTIADSVPKAVELSPLYKATLARIARDRHDWVSVAQTLRTTLESLRKNSA